MNDKYFIDTDIFIASFNSKKPTKQRTAVSLIERALRTSSGVISYQVLQEFLNVATRHFPTPMLHVDCQRYLNNVLEPLCEVYTNIELYHSALDIMDKLKYPYYDSLVIAAALRVDCKHLFSVNMVHKQKIENTIIFNPFL